MYCKIPVTKINLYLCIHTGTHTFIYTQKKLWKVPHQRANWVPSRSGAEEAFPLYFCMAWIFFSLQVQVCGHFLTMKMNYCVVFRILSCRKAAGCLNTFLLWPPRPCPGAPIILLAASLNAPCDAMPPSLLFRLQNFRPSVQRQLWPPLEGISGFGLVGCSHICFSVGH